MGRARRGRPASPAGPVLFRLAAIDYLPLLFLDCSGKGYLFIIFYSSTSNDICKSKQASGGLDFFFYSFFFRRLNKAAFLQ